MKCVCFQRGSTLVKHISLEYLTRVQIVSPYLMDRSTINDIRNGRYRLDRAAYDSSTRE